MSKEYEAVRAEYSKICNLIDQLKTVAHDLHRDVEVADLLENARLKWENLTARERQLVNQAVNQ